MREPRPLSMERISAVLFDLDGTLIESDDRWVEKIAGRLGFLRRLSPPHRHCRRRALDGDGRRDPQLTMCSLPWSTWGSRPVCLA